MHPSHGRGTLPPYIRIKFLGAEQVMALLGPKSVAMLIGGKRWKSTTSRYGLWHQLPGRDANLLSRQKRTATQASMLHHDIS